jgi:hypothetical protein
MREMQETKVSFKIGSLVFGNRTKDIPDNINSTLESIWNFRALTYLVSEALGQPFHCLSKQRGQIRILDTLL